MCKKTSYSCNTTTQENLLLVICFVFTFCWQFVFNLVLKCVSTALYKAGRWKPWKIPFSWDEDKGEAMIRLIVLIANFMTFYGFYEMGFTILLQSRSTARITTQRKTKWTLVCLIILVPLLRVKYRGSRFKI